MAAVRRDWLCMGLALVVAGLALPCRGAVVVCVSPLGGGDGSADSPTDLQSASTAAITDGEDTVRGAHRERQDRRGTCSSHL